MSHDLELKWQDASLVEYADPSMVAGPAVSFNGRACPPTSRMNRGAMARTEPYSPDCSWAEKFRCAFRGVRLGVRGQRSFLVHSVFAIAVIACAAGFRVTLVEWSIVLLCITVMMTAEMFNSALETLAKAITDEEHDYLGIALDIGSAAVLIASVGAAIVGSIVFINRLGMALGWW